MYEGGKVCIPSTFVALGCDYLEIGVRCGQVFKPNNEAVFIVFLFIYKFCDVLQERGRYMSKKKPSISTLFDEVFHFRVFQTETVFQMEYMYSISVFHARCHYVIGLGIYVLRS